MWVFYRVEYEKIHSKIKKSPSPGAKQNEAIV